jgi:large subunit ribosomal protein L25
MVKDLKVAAEGRESRGKNEARRLRVKGLVPAVVYGGTEEPAAISVDPKEITRILHSRTGHNTIFHLTTTGAADTPVMIVDWQYEPIKESLLHVDLKRIDLSKRITVKVPVVTLGDPKGVKLQGGIHEIVTREIEIECLPNDIPEQFEVNVAELSIGQSIRAGDIPLVGSMTLLSPADAVISHVVSLRAEESTTAETGGTAAAEPEVVKKGKKEEEGGESAGKKK